MSIELPTDVTRILNNLDAKDRSAVSKVLPVIYEELRRLADSYFQRERTDHTLQPTALVHEAYIRLVHGKNGQWESRQHFFRTAAVIMRHLLVKHARDRGRLKRGGDQRRSPLDNDVPAATEGDIDILTLNEALERLAEFDARQSQIVELRFFAGLTIKEVAEDLGVSERTVFDDWSLAKAWLWREMNR